MTHGNPPEQPDPKSLQTGTPILEWLFALFGAAIVMGLIAFNTLEALTDEGTPPHIRVEVLTMVPIETGVLVRIRAVNSGGTSAAGLVIEGSLREGEKELEVSQVTFDYVPAHSTKEGGLFFVQDARRLPLTLRPLGYQDP